MKKSLKKSQTLPIFLMGCSLVSLTACDENPNNTPPAFKDEQECRKVHTEEECKKAMAESKAQYAATAPKFTNKEECEKQYGPGKCTEGHYQGGHGGGFFMPMMMGFMMGKMMGGFSRPALPPVVGSTFGNRSWSNRASGPSRTVTRGGFGRSGSFRSSGS